MVDLIVFLYNGYINYIIIIMRSPRNRHSIRKNRVYKRETYIKSANVIQSFCSKFLKQRYEGRCINYDDDDIFTFEPVCLIPRGLMIIVEGHGFNSLNLLSWILRSSKGFQVHPITRNKLEECVEVLCVYNITCFLRNDSKKFTKGYYKRRKLAKKVLTRYTSNQ